MGAPGFFQQARPLFRGRWQIPVALAGVVVAALTLYHLMPPRRVENFEPLLAEVAALEEGGAVSAAA